MKAVDLTNVIFRAGKLIYFAAPANEGALNLDASTPHGALNSSSISGREYKPTDSTVRH
jgi:hypothetical protein